MAISGLVLTLSDDAAAEGALTALKSDARLTLGEQFGRRAAVVAETPSAHDDHVLFEALRCMPGVRHVDVTFVHLDEPAASEDSDTEGRSEDQHAHR